MSPPQKVALPRRAVFVGVSYFLAAALVISFARFGNGVAIIWLASGILLAELTILDRRQWGATVAACAVGSMLATGLFGFGWLAAGPLVIANLFEAILGAVLLQRLERQQNYLDSVEGLATFALAGCFLPSAASGLLASSIVSAATGMPLAGEWFAWFAGHGLGTLTFAPIAALALSGELGGSIRQARLATRIETAALLAVVAVVCLFVFSQEKLPLLFVPMLPLVVVAFRLDRSGALTALILLAVIGGLLTALGHGPINMVQASAAGRAQLFQFFLAITLLTILPVVAELKQRKLLFRRLLESEARYKLITESSTDMIVTLNARGIITYASPSALEITGFPSEMLIGRRPHNLIESPEAAAIDAAYARVFADPGTTATVEYRGLTAEGAYKWFESNTRSIVDEQGQPAGWVSAVRDISRRKSLELRLAHAAATDSLTGLPNRRAFDARLDRLIADRRSGTPAGCVAVFDIDFFKRVNDEYGHAVGDEVLERFATVAQATLRSGDHVARLGGEEFGLLLGGADIKQAMRVCDRLRLAIAQGVTRAPDGSVITVTVSAGIATIDGTATRHQIMRAADAALYRAKAAGRDRLAIAA